jgi:hypothetical protein
MKVYLPEGAMVLQEVAGPFISCTFAVPLSPPPSSFFSLLWWYGVWRKLIKFDQIPSLRSFPFTARS